MRMPAHPRDRRPPLLAMAAFLLCLATPWAMATDVEVTYDFDAPRVVRQGEHAAVTLKGTRQLQVVGEPMLPVATARILLPPHGKVLGVTVERLGEARTPPGKWNVRFGRTPVPIGIKNHPSLALAAGDAPNPAVYGADAAYPASQAELTSVQRLCGYRIAIVRIYPVQYLPASGKLISWPRLKVTVSLGNGPEGAEAAAMLRPRGARRVAEFVDNPQAAAAYADLLRARAAPTTAYDYLLVTRSALMADFAPLVSQKTAGGLAVKTETVENILASQPGVDDAEKLRNYIIYAYQNWGIQYVLLGGDVDTAPYREGYGSAGGEEDGLPCDLYFACLDGTWNSDGDALWGETTDGEAGGEVDLLGEVYVGRAPVDNAAEAARFVGKVTGYHANGTANPYEAAFVAEYLGLYYGSIHAQGGDCLDYTEPNFALYSRTWLDDRPVNGATWGSSQCIAQLNAGPHLIAHCGHGSPLSTMRLTTSHIDSLTNTDLFLLNSVACDSGAFDYGSADCLAEEFIKRTDRGAFAVIMNSRYGWFNAYSEYMFSGEFLEAFYDRMLQHGDRSPGAALQLSKHEMVGAATNMTYRWCYFELNLFGDPETAIKTPLAISSGSPLPVGYTGAAYTFQMVAGGSTPPLNWSIVAGALPTGLDIAPATGLISGTPASTGLYAFTVGLDDATPAAPVTKEFELTVVDQLLIETADPLPPAVLGAFYSVDLQAAGGAKPYQWSLEVAYEEDDPGATWFGGGTAQGWQADDQSWSYSLPWDFPFYGQTYNSCYVSSNGFIDFAVADGDWQNTTQKLIDNVRVAPLWDDLLTTGGDIYVTETDEHVVIRWDAVTYSGSYPVSIELALYRTGEVRFNYGVGNSVTTPTIGISAGNGTDYGLSGYDAQPDIPDNVSTRFMAIGPPDGLTLDETTGRISGTPAELGASEFAARCRDSGPPQQTASKLFHLTVGENTLGFEHGIAAVGAQWLTVNFTAALTDPVVVAGPASDNDPEPGVVRIRNVNGTSFQIRFQEWDYLDGVHDSEEIHWLAIGSGVHDLGAGKTLIAGTTVVAGPRLYNASRVDFPQSFGSPPVVLAQIVTQNGWDAVTDRITSVDAAGFSVAMQEQESDAYHAAETVGYVAVSDGAAQIGSVPCRAGRLSAVLTHRPFLLGSALGQVMVKAEEEQSADAELGHWSAEDVGYLALSGAPAAVVDVQSANGADPCVVRCSALSSTFQCEDGVASAGSAWTTIDLADSYADPVVVVGPATSMGPQPGAVRVRNVTSGSFEVRFQEWPYLDGWHPAELMHYMVVERGVWDIGGGRLLIAHTFRTGNTNPASPTQVPLPAGLSAPPVLVASQQTADGADLVTERLSSIGASGFSVFIQEQEAGGAHCYEEVGFVAVGPGMGGVDAGSVAIAAMTGEPDKWSVTPTEEQSADSETTHGAETIGALVFAGGSPNFVAAMQSCNDTDTASLRCAYVGTLCLALGAEDRDGAPLAGQPLGVGARPDRADLTVVTGDEPVRVPWANGETLHLWAPESIASGAEALLFDCWLVDGLALKAGPAIALKMTRTRTAIAVYRPVEAVAP